MIFRCVRIWCLRAEVALMRAHVQEWEDDLRRLPAAIGEYQRRIVEAEAALRDLTSERDAHGDRTHRPVSRPTHRNKP